MAEDASLANLSQWMDDNVGCSSSLRLAEKSLGSVLDNLRERFNGGRTFTELGGLTMACTNSKRTVSYYSDDFVDLYKNSESSLDLPQHLYRICRWCHRNVYQRNIDTGIIFHGEAGSGKSESFKHAIHYVAHTRSGAEVGQVSLAIQKLQHVLEVFGCAWSASNRSATKFGELLEIGLDFKGEPQNVRLTVMPLHKNHLTSRNFQIESNFLAFYCLLYGADTQMLKTLKLHRNPLNYAFLKTGALPNLPMDYWRERFADLNTSLNDLSFTEQESEQMYQILALILKLGNVQFHFNVNFDDTTGCCIKDEYELNDICKLVGCDLQLIRDALTKKSWLVNAESINVELSEDEAQILRDFACSTVYSRLWLWISGKINQKFANFQLDRCVRKLYLLDTSGYNRNTNCMSIDDLLSNYANERTLVMYIDKLFKEPQALYADEGLLWENVDVGRDDSTLTQLDALFIYLDNSDTDNLDIAEKFREHVFQDPAATVVNDESKQKLDFRIVHFFGEVHYDATRFREKNWVTLSDEYLNLFHTSSLELLNVLFPEKRNVTACKSHKKTLTHSAQYKVCVNAIMKTLENVECAHVLCLKSNDLNQPSQFDETCVERQLEEFRVVKLVQMYSDGFAASQTYDLCLNRYKMLSPATWPLWTDQSRQGVVEILKYGDVPAKHVAMGKQKIFFKFIETVVQLEDRREKALHKLACVIQHAFRTWYVRKSNCNVNKSHARIAAHFRAFKARREYSVKKRAGLLIAMHFRRWKVRREFRLKREGEASIKLFNYLRFVCKKIFLLRLADNLPSMSPMCQEWPTHLVPTFCKEADALIQFQYHRFRCRKYRQLIDQQTYFRLREKVAASVIFSGKKTAYFSSVSHSFRGDYVRIRQSARWRKVALETGDEYVVFADIASKVHRTSGKVSSILIVLSTSGILVLDHRSLTLKHRAPVTDVDKISMSPYNDPVAVFTMRNAYLSRKPGDFVFECRHIVELIAKMYLVIQNAIGKAPLIVFSPEITFKVDGEKMLLVFNRKENVEGGNDEGPTSVGCFTASPSLILRPTTPPTTVINHDKTATTPSTSRSSEDTNNAEVYHSPQIQRLKLVRKGMRLDIFI